MAFTAIDLTKDLEIARHALINKVPSPVHEIPVDSALEELIDEQSDDEDPIVSTPKKKSKPLVRLSLSGPRKKKKKNKSKGIPTQVNSGMVGDQGIRGPSIKPIVIKIKKKNKRSHVELQGHQEKRCHLLLKKPDF